MATLTYSRNYTTNDMSRLSCTFKGEYKSIQWERESEGFTSSGEIDSVNKYCTVTIKTPQVTATGWNNNGSTIYRLYCVLYTKNGLSYTSETQDVEWYKDPKDNRTLTFTITDVIGEWDYFEIWAQQRTYTTNSHYLYWFNNGSGTITVTYETQANFPTTAFVRTANGEWAKGTVYIYKSGNWIQSSLGVWTNGDWVEY